MEAKAPPHIQAKAKAKKAKRNAKVERPCSPEFLGTYADFYDVVCQ